MKVLVVDDEPGVRGLVCNILATAGHQAVQAANGAEALELTTRDHFDLVITDLTMPGMSGRELVSQLKERRCPARCLLISGYIDDEQSPAVPFLAKPFTAGALIAAVEKLKEPAALPEPQQQIQQARTEWLEAMADFNSVVSDVPSGIPSPDGTQRVLAAGRRRSRAFKKYREALNRSVTPDSDGESQRKPGE